MPKSWKLDDDRLPSFRLSKSSLSPGMLDLSLLLEQQDHNRASAAITRILPPKRDRWKSTARSTSHFGAGHWQRRHNDQKWIEQIRSDSVPDRSNGVDPELAFSSLDKSFRTTRWFRQCLVAAQSSTSLRRFSRLGQEPSQRS